MKEDLTVDDILGARPSLRDRAAAAHKLREEEKKRDFDEQVEAVTAAALAFCSAELEMSSSELADVEISSNKRNPTTPQVFIKVDGVHLRFWHSVVGDDVQLKVEVQKKKPPMAWSVIKTLADIGEHI